VAEECAAILMAGYVTSDGQRMWWTSVELACEENTRLQEVVKDFGVKPKYMLHRMKHVQPDLVRRNLYVHKPLVNRRHDVAFLRCKDAKYLLTLPQHVFKRVFWLDMASMCVMPDRQVQVWTGKDQDMLQRTDPHMGLSPKNMVWLRYYAVVNWLKGAVAIVFVTGTTGVPVVYKVGAHTLAVS
jgi:hypothetical protein